MTQNLEAKALKAAWNAYMVSATKLPPAGSTLDEWSKDCVSIAIRAYLASQEAAAPSEIRQVIFDALDLSEELRIECTADVVTALTEAGFFAPAAAPSEEPDEVTEDEIRSRAKDIIRRNGWLEQKAPPQLHSIIELMVSLGLDVLKNRPASCGYPGCGCDFDAVCNAALAVAPVAVSVKDDEDDPACTDCGGTGVTYQTEKRCTCQPREWRYDIMYGPDGETNYAWVYNDKGEMVCTTKLHHAIAIVERFNARILSSIIPATKGGEDSSELQRAANALLNNLWAGVVSGARSHEENWQAFERRFPGVKSLHEALAALAQDTDGVAREVAWLIERKFPPTALWYAENATGFHWWASDANLAKRFASKAEAEAFPAYQMIASDPAISVTEHVFLGANP